MRKKGISLIVLIITIIVIIILAGAIIQILTKQNVIEMAENARFRHNLSEYNSELELWESNESIKTLGKLDLSQINALKDYGDYNGKTIKDLIPDIRDKDIDRVKIINGKAEEIKGIYTDKEISEMIKNGYIPIANADELNNIRCNKENIFGKGTKWEKTYMGGIDKKYVQVAEIQLGAYQSGSGWIPIEQGFVGTYDGNNYDILGLRINNTNDSSMESIGLFSYLGDKIDDKDIYANLLNINLVNVNISTNDSHQVGSLCGGSEYANISNINLSGNISANNVDSVGSLTGCIVNHTNDIKNITSTTNLNLKDCGSVGGIAGYLVASDENTLNLYYNGVINCTSKNYISRYNKNYAYGNIGGLIGYGNGKIYNSHSKCKIYLNIDNSISSTVNFGYVGGFIGNYDAEVSNCYSDSDIYLNSKNINVNGLGGFIGSYVGSSMSNNYCDFSNIYNNNCDNVGGFIGYACGCNINNCYSNSNITGNEEVGGFIGNNDGSNIDNCHSSGRVIGNKNIGGFCGYAGGYNLSNSYSNNVYVIGNENVGGLCGYSTIPLTNCYVSGNVYGKDYIGGIIGYDMGYGFKNVNFKGNVVGNNYVGGMIGTTFCENINNAYTIIYNITGNDYVGGIVGYYTGSGMDTCCCIVKNKIKGNNYVGGVVGKFDNAGGSNNLYAKINKIEGNNYVGGIMGIYVGSPTVSNVYANVNEITGNDCVAGIIGNNIKQQLILENVCSSCNIKGNSNVGNIVGENSDTSGKMSISSVYWNSDLSSINSDLVGAVGKTSEQLKQKDTYANWNFDTVWKINSDKNDGYPYLSYFESII